MQHEKKVFIYIQAYNAERQIEKAINSILSQTYPHFICFVCNNGSTDNTKQIIEKLELKDSRVVTWSNPQNELAVLLEKIIPMIFEKYSEEVSYFCNLDADDEYYPNFLEDGLEFLECYNLDAVSCGSDFISAESGKMLGQRKIEKSIILNRKEDFDYYFPQYYQFMRTVWGKIYRISRLERINIVRNSDIWYGLDTLFTLEAFICCRRVGIMQKVLHKYYVSEKSYSNKFDRKRIYSDAILFDKACDFLFLKCGKICSNNLDFLFKVYYYAIQDTTNLLLHSEISNSEKMNFLYEIICNRHTEVFCRKYHVEKLFENIKKWLCSADIEYDQKNILMEAKLFAMIGFCPESMRNFEAYQLLELQLYIKKNWKIQDGLSYVEQCITKLVSKFPLLSGLSIDFLVYYQNIIHLVIQNRNEEALNIILSDVIEGIDIPNKYCLQFIALGLNLAAIMKKQTEYILLKKVNILVLIESHQNERAYKELEDWDTILPEDTDFKEFRNRLTLS